MPSCRRKAPRIIKPCSTNSRTNSSPSPPSSKVSSASSPTRIGACAAPPASKPPCCSSASNESRRFTDKYPDELPDDPALSEICLLGYALINDADGSDPLSKLSRHEARLTRRYFKALAQLLKARRACQTSRAQPRPTAAPAPSAPAPSAAAPPSAAPTQATASNPANPNEPAPAANAASQPSTAESPRRAKNTKN